MPTREEELEAELNDLMSFMPCGHRQANTMYNEGTDYDEDICHACWTMMRMRYDIAAFIRSHNSESARIVLDGLADAIERGDYTKKG